MKKKYEPVMPASTSFQGYLLTDFLDNSHLGDLRTMLHKGALGHLGKYVHKGPKAVVGDLKSALEGVYLAKFESSVTPGEPPIYVYEIGLNSERTVGAVLSNPFDTVLVFGAPKKKPPGGGGGSPPDPHLPVPKPGTPGVGTIGTRGYVMKSSKAKPTTGKATVGKPTGGKPAGGKLVGGRPTVPHVVAAPDPRFPIPVLRPVSAPCDLSLRFVVNFQNVLQSVHIFGTSVRFYFSTGLVQPVRKASGGKYVEKEGRLKVALGDATILLRRGHRPHLSKVLTFDDNLVRIGGQGLIAKLHKVTLGGTFEKPKMVFKETEIVF